MRIRIVPYTPKHELRFISHLLQIVQDYLQYEEALEVYEYFRTKEPERPLIKLSELNHNPGSPEYIFARYYSDSKPGIPTRSNTLRRKDNIKFYYIPYEEGYNFNSYILTSLVYYGLDVFLQCSRCSEYTRIKYNDNENKTRILINKVYYNRNNYKVRLCSCKLALTTDLPNRAIKVEACYETTLNLRQGIDS